jgi:protein ImuB
MIGVRISIALTARLQSRQRHLFNDDDDTRRELALLVDRLSSRLGREAVVRAALVSDAQPEFAYRYEPLAGSNPRRRKELAGAPYRPLLVEPRPLPLEVVSVVPDGPPIQIHLHGHEHRVARSWGPERIQTGWWRGGYIRRDYYRVVTTEGNRFWLFRHRGEWFLHGVFD